LFKLKFLIDKDAIDHASNILKTAQRRYYSFLIGKLNCPKLNNFLEIDMYVLVACPENSLINSKELNKPIITLYELEIAFNCARLWGEEFICDYKQILTGSDHYVPLKLTDQESDVSLITGGTRVLTLSKENELLKQSLIKRDDALSVIHFSGAGNLVLSINYVLIS
jgi:diphthamide biosynthesis protein 2